MNDVKDNTVVKEVGVGKSALHNTVVLLFMAALFVYAYGGITPATHSSDETLPGNQTFPIMEHVDKDDEDVWIVWKCYTIDYRYFVCKACPDGKIEMDSGELYAVLLFNASEELEMHRLCNEGSIMPEEVFRGGKEEAMAVYARIMLNVPKIPPGNII